MSTTRLFLGQFVRDPTGVAAIAPSSRFLARRMLAATDLAPGGTIVELGPGTGAFTRLIRQLAPDGLRYLGIERDQVFVAHLQQTFPQFEFAHGTAQDIAELVAARGMPPVRTVISGLPLASMRAATRHRIVDATSEVLQGGGSFHQFSYVHFFPFPGAVDLRARMRTRFDDFSVSRPVLRNLPPAFVYRGRNR